MVSGLWVCQHSWAALVYAAGLSERRLHVLYAGEGSCLRDNVEIE